MGAERVADHLRLLHHALQVFEAHRVSAETFERQGADIARSPNLIVRLGGELYPWSVAMPAVMGALAFGGSWQQRLAAQGPGLAAGKADEEPPRKVRLAGANS